jgi:hypothetical protein
MSSRYTVEAGRAIYRNGAPFISINRDDPPGGYTQPTDVDSVTHAICRALNKLARRTCKKCDRTCDVHHYSCPDR